MLWKMYFYMFPLLLIRHQEGHPACKEYITPSSACNSPNRPRKRRVFKFVYLLTYLLTYSLKIFEDHKLTQIYMKMANELVVYVSVCC